MLFSIAVTLLFLSFFASVVLTGYFRNIAQANNLLIDIPDKSRKFHIRPTPLIGGLSIHASILLSSLFMLFLIDYKYDFEFDGLSLIKSTQLENTREVRYSKRLSIKNEENGDFENFRLNITPQQNSDEASKSYDVDFGSNFDGSINITQISENIFDVTLPTGEIKTFQSTDSGVVELNPSGEEISDPYIVASEPSNFFSFSSFTAAFIAVAILLQAFILFDDAFGIKATKRLFIQSIAALALIMIGDIYISDLKMSLLGIDMKLGLWGIPFTIFAVVGIVNAFNMIDGINGLCAGFALIALGALQTGSGFDVANYSLVIAMGSIVGFLFYNLGFLGTKRRVFLGDNGSTFLGFLVAWTSINYSQSDESLIHPVTCLWIVAIPLLDCLGVIAARAIRGILPFRPGRDHIHHKLQNITKSSSKTLVGLMVLGSLVASVGILIEKSYLSAEISFVLFAVFALIFYFGSGRLSSQIQDNV